VKGFEFGNAIEKMNTSQKIIPIIEFGEVKFEPEILRSKISLKRTVQELEIHRANITAQAVFSRGVENPRGGSEGVSSFGLLVQSFRPRPLRSLKNLEHLSIPNAKQNQTTHEKRKNISPH